MTNEKDPTLAETVGTGFAYVQHGMDRAIEWGFKKMEETQKNAPKKSTITNPTIKKVADAGRSALGFLGRAGKAYYRKYEELKRN